MHTHLDGNKGCWGFSPYTSFPLNIGLTTSLIKLILPPPVSFLEGWKPVEAATHEVMCKPTGSHWNPYFFRFGLYRELQSKKYINCGYQAHFRWKPIHPSSKPSGIYNLHHQYPPATPNRRMLVAPWFPTGTATITWAKISAIVCLLIQRRAS